MSKELKRHSVRGVKYNGEEICGGFAYYDADDVDALLAEKDMEIFNLKEELSYIKADSAFDRDKHEELLKSKDKDIESLKASHYAEMVDAGMRERRLKRALYIVLARSFCCMRELAARNALYDDECKWDNFKTTCLKKAEEYK